MNKSWRYSLTVGVVALGAGAATLGLGANRDNDPAHLMVAAQASLAKGDLRGAEIRLRNVLRQKPADVEARLTLGTILLQRRLPKAAQETFEAALKYGAVADRVVPLLADAYLAEGQSGRLLDRLADKALETQAPQQVHLARGWALIAQDQWRDAEPEVRLAIAAGGEAAKPLLALAAIKGHDHDLAGAESLVDQALAGSPRDVGALTAKGDLRRRQGDGAGAIRAFDAALAERPDDPQANLGAAMVHLALGHTDAAATHVETVLRRSPGQPQALYLKALLLDGQGKTADALAVLEPAAPHLDGMMGLHVLLAKLNLRLGHPGKALTEAQRVVAMAPDAPAARSILATVLAQQNQPRKVVEVLEPMAARAADDPVVQTLLGEAYGKLGRFQDSAAALDKAARLNPSDVELRTDLDVSRLGVGADDLAVRDLTDLVSAHPESARAATLLALADMRLGRLADAAKAAEALRTRQPDNPAADNLAGLIHARMGDIEAARHDFAAALTKQPKFFPAADNLARLAVGRGQLDEAHRVLAAAAQADPANDKPLVALARLSQLQGDPAAAAKWLEEACTAVPTALEPRLALIGLLLADGKTDQALVRADEAASRFGDNPEFLAALGRAQWAAGQDRNAMASLARAVGLRPDAFGAWRDLVALQGKIGGLDKALETAHSAGPAMENTLRAEAFLDAKRYPEADAAYAVSLAQRPATAILLRRAQVRAMAGDPGGARTILSEWLKTHPGDQPVRAALATYLLAAGNYAAAAGAYETVLKAQPDDVVTLNNLAWLHARAGQADAIDLARRAHDLAPGAATVSDTLGWLLVGHGDVKAALALLADAHRQWPKNGEIAYHYAAALARSGDTTRAAAILRPAVESAQAFAEQPEARKLLQQLADGR